MRVYIPGSSDYFRFSASNRGKAIIRLFPTVFIKDQRPLVLDAFDWCIAEFGHHSRCFTHRMNLDEWETMTLPRGWWEFSNEGDRWIFGFTNQAPDAKLVEFKLRFG